MAVSTDTTKKYLPTIGIETHVQLKTKTKLFAAVGNDARAAKPNTLISHICVGLPGALPVLNSAAIDLSSKAAVALGTTPQKFSRFERKHYFYPDLPKGYQITQLEDPIIKGGFVEIKLDGKPKRINIERANLEEDAGKNIHPEGADYSLVDLNRAGTPLLEIVSKPEINSAAEAKAYARELWLLMKYAGVTEGDLYHGHVRFDVNVSVSSEQGKLGTRSEIKNINSFRSVENAVDYEIKRQIEVLESGQKVVQETRGWDEAKQKSIGQRGKEEAQDYRYMPEPDVPPTQLSDEYIENTKSSLPQLPDSIRQKLSQLDINSKVVEDILDSSEVYGRLLEARKYNSEPGVLRRILFDSLENVKNLKVNVEEHVKVAAAVEAGELNSSAGWEALQDIISGKDAGAAIGSHTQVSDEAEIEKIVFDVLEENQKAADDVKKGEMKAVGFLVGQVMQKSGGKANPSIAQRLIKKQLGVQ